jgi:hypothetical protein
MLLLLFAPKDGVDVAGDALLGDFRKGRLTSRLR